MPPGTSWKVPLSLNLSSNRVWIRISRQWQEMARHSRLKHLLTALAYTDPRSRNQECPCGGVSRGGRGRRREWCPPRPPHLLTPGPQALWGASRADVGAASPSLLQTRSRLRESSPALWKHQQGHPGTVSELMRPPITFICFAELYPAMTPLPPHVAKFPPPPSCSFRTSG